MVLEGESARQLQLSNIKGRVRELALFFMHISNHNHLLLELSLSEEVGVIPEPFSEDSLLVLVDFNFRLKVQRF